MHLIGVLGLTACDRDALNPYEPARHAPGAASASVAGATELAASPELRTALGYGIEDAKTRVLPSFPRRPAVARLEVSLTAVASALQTQNAAATREAVQQAARSLAAAETEPGMAGHVADTAAIRLLLQTIDSALAPSLTVAQ